jgi:predicted MFS family arabinose efflux permease
MQPTRGHAALALGLLTAVNLLSYLQRSVVFALFDPIKADLGLNDAQLGLFASAYILAYSLAALPLGVLGDLRSRKLVVAGGVLVMASFSAAGAVTSGFAALLACRALVGTGGAAAGAPAASLVAGYYPGARRAMAMALFMAGPPLGGVLGIVAGGQLVTAFGWRPTLTMLGLPFLLLAVLVLLLREPPRAERARGGQGLAALWRSAAMVRTVPTLAFVFLGGAMISFGVNGLAGWAPTYMAREMAIPIDRVALLLAQYGLPGGILGTLTGGILADQLRHRTSAGRAIVAGVGILVGAGLIMYLITVRDLAVFLPVFAAAFFFLSWYVGPLTAVIFDVVPSGIGSTVVGAYFLFIHVAGDALAFPLVGLLSDRFGLPRAMFVLPAVAFFGGLVVLGAALTVRQDMARMAATEGVGA